MTKYLPLWTSQEGFIYDTEHPWYKALINLDKMTVVNEEG